jgi:hypothetical protein
MSTNPIPTIYIGPNSPKLGLSRFHHYTALNPHIQAALTQHPALKLLFIPLDQFSTRARTIYANGDASINHAVLSLINAGVF